MPALQVRQARATDTAAACAVLRRSITELCAADHGNDPQFLGRWLANKTVENVAAWIADPDSIVYVAVDDEAIVGVASLKRTGLITLNYVSPDARFQGVSKALLAQIEQTAATLGLTQCSLASTKTALRFYRSAGYSAQQNDGSTWGTPMSKAIAEPPAGR